MAEARRVIPDIDFNGKSAKKSLDRNRPVTRLWHHRDKPMRDFLRLFNITIKVVCLQGFSFYFSANFSIKNKKPKPVT